LGVPLHKLLGWPGPMTHRQYRAWDEWLLLELNRPGRLEHYVLLVVREVRRFMGMFTKDGAGPLDLDSMRIPFERRAPAPPPTPQAAAERGARSKAVWRGIFAGLKAAGGRKRR
jgi:hypothetical protein